jgi:transcription elongation factor Elf1
MATQNKLKKQHTCLGCHKKISTKQINTQTRMGFCDQCGEFPYVLAKVNAKGELLGEYNDIVCWACERGNRFYFPYRITEHAKKCKGCGEIAIIIDETFVREYLNDIQQNTHLIRG